MTRRCCSVCREPVAPGVAACTTCPDGLVIEIADEEMGPIVPEPDRPGPPIMPDFVFEDEEAVPLHAEQPNLPSQQESASPSSRGVADFPLNVQQDPTFLFALVRCASAEAATPPLGAIRVLDPWSESASWTVTEVPARTASSGHRELGWFLVTRLLGKDPVSGLGLHLLGTTSQVPPDDGLARATMTAPARALEPGPWSRWRFLIERLFGEPTDPEELRRWVAGELLPPLRSRDGRHEAWSPATLDAWAKEDRPSAAAALATPGAELLVAAPERDRFRDLLVDGRLHPEERLDLFLLWTLPGFEPTRLVDGADPGPARSPLMIDPEAGRVVALLATPVGEWIQRLAPQSRLGAQLHRAGARHSLLEREGLAGSDPLLATLLLASPEAVRAAAQERLEADYDERDALLALARLILEPSPEDLLSPAERRALRGLERLRTRGVAFDEPAAAALFRAQPRLTHELRWDAESRRLGCVRPTAGPLLELLGTPTTTLEDAVLLLTLTAGTYETHAEIAERRWQEMLRALDEVIERAKAEAAVATREAGIAEAAYRDLVDRMRVSREAERAPR